MAEEKKEAQASEEKKEEAKAQEEKPQKEEKEEAPKEEAPKEEASEEVEVPEKFKDFVEKIEKMSVLDLAELVKILEKKFGVSASAPAAPAPAGEQGGGEQAEEKSEFNIVLSSVGEKKIEVIKVVRDITQKGLKDAKDLVDSATLEPQTIKEGVKKEEAEEMKKKFEEAGAKVELK